ncbi:hypothetical protein HMPREF9404_3899 [Eggerthella sp. HGA1]|nr:hypothetical protein HMPREF9404_3899 [Eggerthella sp. HGA1]
MQVVGRARLGAFLRCFGRPGALPGALMTVCRPVIAPSSQNRCETLITQLLTMPARALRTGAPEPSGGGAGQAARRALSTWSLPRFTRGYCFFCDAPLAQYRRITALLAMRPIPDDPYDGTRFQARRASRCAVLHMPQREARPLGKQA